MKSKNQPKEKMKSSNQRKEKMQSENQQKDNEVLDMFSARKLVNELMRRDNLTPNLMMKKTGMPEQNIVEILEGKRLITSGIALLFERCLNWPATELLDQQSLDLLARLETRAKKIQNYLEFKKNAAEIQESIAQLDRKLFGAE